VVNSGAPRLLSNSLAMCETRNAAEGVGSGADLASDAAALMPLDSCVTEPIDETGIRALADFFLLLAEWDAKTPAVTA
jgi:hypothetical protein